MREGDDELRALIALTGLGQGEHQQGLGESYRFRPTKFHFVKSGGQRSGRMAETYINVALRADRHRMVIFALLVGCLLTNVALGWSGADYRAIVLTSIFAEVLLAAWLQGRFTANGQTPWAVACGIVAVASIAAWVPPGGGYLVVGLAIPFAVATILVVSRFGL